MLEIFFLIRFGQALAKAARERNRSGGWAALGVAFWIGGEVAGFVVAGLLGLETLPGYGLALGMAITGAVVSYLVVSNLPPAPAALEARG